MNYLEEVQKGMDYLAKQSDTLFVGQAMRVKGHAVTHQVKNFPQEKLIELPVAEEFQAGYCNGLALEGFVPVSIYPRMNFGILAVNQIINHLDKWHAMMSPTVYDDDILYEPPKVIIKMVVGSDHPLDPGNQHKANFTQAFKSMATSLHVVELIKPHHVFETYVDAYDLPKSTLIIEHGDFYNQGK